MAGGVLDHTHSSIAGLRCRHARTTTLMNGYALLRGTHHARRPARMHTRQNRYFTNSAGETVPKMQPEDVMPSFDLSLIHI